LGQDTDAEETTDRLAARFDLDLDTAELVRADVREMSRERNGFSQQSMF